ncbi:MAG: hypothetical protein F6K00_03185 [Leptolyngbya sp. SIOISBB]|nr:hypothetical protein [Leptolyngbya sp. SIOISBB]
MGGNSEERFLDTAYVPAGGKHGIPKVASVLREIGIPVKAVFDIDFLSEQSLVKETVLALGGEWDDMETLWSRVDSSVRNGNRAKSVSEIKAEIISIIESSSENDLPKGDIHEALKQGKPWNIVKKFGDRGIPNGDAQQNYILLREKLENIGIYLVPVGEIENFCPEIGSHGPKYVTKLLSTIPLGDTRLTELRRFVEKVQIGKHCLLENSQSDVLSQT